MKPTLQKLRNILYAPESHVKRTQKAKAWLHKYESNLQKIQDNWKKTPNRWVAVDNPHISIKEILEK